MSSERLVICLSRGAMRAGLTASHYSDDPQFDNELDQVSSGTATEAAQTHKDVPNHTFSKRGIEWKPQ